MNQEQLETLRRQVEEDYRADLAAIERLQRRFLGSRNSIPSSIPSSIPNNSAPVGAYASPSKWQEEVESRLEPPSLEPPRSAPPERQREREELVGSLRTMFNDGRPIGR